jgi:predicted transcriptional regulator of viral defense system
MATKVEKLLNAKQNVFTLDDLGVLWGQTKRSDTTSSARDLAKKNVLTRIKRGIYAINGRNVHSLEIANKLIVPSYITGETALALAGLTFQYTGKIFSVALYNKRIDIEGREQFVYRQMKNDVLMNRSWIESKDGWLIASPERAMCDMIYLHKRSYPFEYFHNINWDKLIEASKIYGSPLVEREALKLREEEENSDDA